MLAEAATVAVLALAPPLIEFAETAAAAVLALAPLPLVFAEAAAAAVFRQPLPLVFADAAAAAVSALAPLPLRLAEAAAAAVLALAPPPLVFAEAAAAAVFAPAPRPLVFAEAAAALLGCARMCRLCCVRVRCCWVHTMLFVLGAFLVALRAPLSFSSCPLRQFLCRWLQVGKVAEEVVWQDLPLLLRLQPVLGQCLRSC